MVAHGRACLHPPRRRRTAPPPARARDGPVRPYPTTSCRWRDRARGGHLEGAAVPLLPAQAGVFVATLEERPRSSPRCTARPLAAAARAARCSLDAWLGWVEENREAYGKLLRSAAAIPEVRQLVERVRDATSARSSRHLAGRPAAGAARRRARVAVVHGRREPRLGRAARPHARTAKGLLLGTLLGAVTAAGEPAPRCRYWTPSRSTTNTSVSFGPIAGGGPGRRRRGRRDDELAGPPTFMPSTPWSQPGMTWPRRAGSERLAAVPGGVELAPFVNEMPTYWT